MTERTHSGVTELPRISEEQQAAQPFIEKLLNQTPDKVAALNIIEALLRVSDIEQVAGLAAARTNQSDQLKGDDQVRFSDYTRTNPDYAEANRHLDELTAQAGDWGQLLRTAAELRIQLDANESMERSRAVKLTGGPLRPQAEGAVIKGWRESIAEIKLQESI